MVSNMKKTLAGVALAALPLMASAQMNEMQDQAMSAVSGQLGIIDITNIGLGVALFDVPGAVGPAIIDPVDFDLTNFGPTVTPFGLNIGLFDTPFSIGPEIVDLIDIDLTNFGPTFSPFNFGIKVGLFDIIPGAGPAIFDLPEATFKASVLGGLGAGLVGGYIATNGLVLPVPQVAFQNVRVF